MTHPMLRNGLAVGLALAMSAGASADDAAAVRKDLMAVIALHGLPCGRVVDVQTLGENNHVASCADGHRYHVFVNANGRVVVEAQ